MSDTKDINWGLPTVQCDSCDQKFAPDRPPERDWFDTNRCSSCGHKHTPVAIRNKLNTRVTYDSSFDSRKSVEHQKDLYLFRVGDMAKIGVSKNVPRRLKETQTHNAREVELINSWSVNDPYAVEDSLHYELLERSERGEWFDISDRSAYDLADAIELYITGREDRSDSDE